MSLKSNRVSLQAILSAVDVLISARHKRTGAMRQQLLLYSCLIAGSFLLKEALAVRETKYYDALGVPPDADDNVIKKAYRKAAL